MIVFFFLTTWCRCSFMVLFSICLEVDHCSSPKQTIMILIIFNSKTKSDSLVCQYQKLKQYAHPGQHANNIINIYKFLLLVFFSLSRFYMCWQLSSYFLSVFVSFFFFSFVTKPTLDKGNICINRKANI